MEFVLCNDRVWIRIQSSRSVCISFVWSMLPMNWADHFLFTPWGMVTHSREIWSANSVVSLVPLRSLCLSLSLCRNHRRYFWFLSNSNLVIQSARTAPVVYRVIWKLIYGTPTENPSIMFVRAPIFNKIMRKKNPIKMSFSFVSSYVRASRMINETKKNSMLTSYDCRSSW